MSSSSNFFGVQKTPATDTRDAYIGKFAVDTTNTNTSNVFIDDFRLFNNALDAQKSQLVYYGQTLISGLAPTNLRITDISSTYVRIQYTANPNAVSYEIRTVPETATFTTADVSFVVTGLSQYVPYTIYVFGVQADGKKGTAAKVAILEPPENMAANVSTNNTAVGLQYSAAFGSSTYRIETIPPTSTLTTSSLTPTLTGFTNADISYTVVVYARDANQGISQGVSRTISSKSEYVVVSDITNTTLSLIYAPMADTSYYEIYTVPATNTTRSTTTSADISGLVAGTAYNIYIRAVNVSGIPSFNATVAITMPRDNLYYYKFEGGRPTAATPINGITTDTSTIGYSSASAIQSIPASTAEYSPDTNKVYIFSSTTSSFITVYDVSSNSISTLSISPLSLAFGTSVFAPNNHKIYVNCTTNFNFVFNPIDNTYTTIPIPQAGGNFPLGQYIPHNQTICYLPHSNVKVMVINTLTNTANEYGPTFPNDNWIGGIYSPLTNKVYGVPYRSNYVCAFDTITNTMDFSAISHTSGIDAIHNNGILAPNGKIYCFAWNSGGTMLVISPLDNSAVEVATLNTGNMQILGGVVSSYDNKIYCSPFQANQNMYVIDPSTNTFSRLTFSSARKYIKTILANNYIYSIPNDATGSMMGIKYSTIAYDASSSSFSTVDSGNPYKAFDASRSSSWISMSNTMYDSSGEYIGTTTTPTQTLGTISGEWLQIRLPYSLRMTQYRFGSRTATPNEMPRIFNIVGSNNGTTWYPIDYQVVSTNISSPPSGATYTNNNVNTVNSYNYFRMIVRNVYENGRFVEILNWDISGEIASFVNYNNNGLTPSYDTTIQGFTIDKITYIRGTGSLSLDATSANSKYVTVSPFTTSTPGFSVAAWVKIASNVEKPIFEFGSTATSDSSAYSPTLVVAGTSKYWGAVAAPNNRIYLIPNSATNVLAIDPSTNLISATITVVAGSYKWSEGILAPNGKIYGIPMDATSVLIIDPSTNTVDTTTITGITGSNKFISGALAPNGKIYCPPYGANYVLVIDTATNTTSQITGTGSGWSGAVLSNNGKIYCVPYSATSVLIIDPTTDTANTATIPISGTNMYGGGALGQNGKIYCVPFDATNVLIIDPSTNTINTSSLLIPDATAGKYRSAVSAPNGRIYGIPQNATNILVIDPVTDTLNTTTLASGLTGLNKFGDAALAYNGQIYVSPNDATSVYVISPYVKSVRIDISNGVPRFSRYTHSNASTNTTLQYSLPVSLSAANNGWNHIGISVDTSGQWTMYLNGLSYYTGITDGINNKTYFSTNYIGRYISDAGAANTATMYIDDFRTYSNAIDFSFVSMLYQGSGYATPSVSPSPLNILDVSTNAIRVSYGAVPKAASYTLRTNPETTTTNTVETDAWITGVSPSPLSTRYTVYGYGANSGGHLSYPTTIRTLLPPTNLSLVSSGDTTATIAFTSATDASNYLITTTPATSNVVVASSPYTITGLGYETIYNVGMRSVGGGTNTNYSGLANLANVSTYSGIMRYYKFDAGDVGANGGVANYNTGVVSTYDNIFYQGFPNNPELLATTNIGMTSDTFSYTDPVNGYRSGTYIASASSFAENPFYAFDNNATTSNSFPMWHCGFNGNNGYTQNPYSSRIYIGGGTGKFWTTPVVGYSSISGEWLQIQMPYQLQVTAYTIRERLSHVGACPRDFFILGSNNGTAWYAVDIITSASYVSSVYTRTGVTASGFYNNFRIVCQTSGGWSAIAIASWEISGVPLATIPTINTSEFKRGTGSLQLVKTNKQYVALPTFTSGSNGFSAATWIKAGTDASNASIMEYAVPNINTYSVWFKLNSAVGSYTTTSTSVVTFDLWFRMSTFSTGNRTIFATNYMQVYGRGDISVIQIWTPNGGNVTVSVPIALDTWYHLAIVFKNNVSNGTLIYFNGIYRGAVTCYYGSYNSTSSMVILGATNSNNFEVTAGTYIDQFRIWNYERTPTEIWNGYNGRYLNTSGLICYLPINEGTGTTLTNLASGQSNFAFNGSPTWETTIPYTLGVSNIINMQLTAGNPTLYAGPSTYTAAVSVNDNSWNHLALAISSSGIWNLYINGLQYNTGITQAITSGTTYTANYIGRYATDTALANTANMYIDDYRDFSRGIDLSYAYFLYSGSPFLSQNLSPTNLTITDVSTSSITVNWTPNLAATTYRVRLVPEVVSPITVSNVSTNQLILSGIVSPSPLSNMYNVFIYGANVSNLLSYPSSAQSFPYKYASTISYAGSMRVFVSGYSGPVVRVRRSSDNVESDFYTDATQSYLTTGVGGTGTSYATWLTASGAATGYITIWYNQNGSSNHARNTATTGIAQPNLLLRNGKYVVQFQNTNNTFMTLDTTVNPNTIFSQFWENNSSYGTIACQANSSGIAVDYGMRFGSTAIDINGISNAGDWFYSSIAPKLSYVNGISTTTLTSTSSWKSFAVSVTTPTLVGSEGFKFIGRDGSATTSRAINGYMTEFIMHNRIMAADTMVDFHKNRLVMDAA